MRKSNKRDESVETSAPSLEGTADGVESGGNGKPTNGSTVDSAQVIDAISEADVRPRIDGQWGKTTRTRIGNLSE